MTISERAGTCLLSALSKLLGFVGSIGFHLCLGLQCSDCLPHKKMHRRRRWSRRSRLLVQPKQWRLNLFHSRGLNVLWVQ